MATRARRGEAEATVRRRWAEGIRPALALVAGYFPAAVAFGVIADQAGLSALEALLISGIVFAGASQFALVGLLAAGASAPVAALTALFLNLRHLLYGPALAPHLKHFGVVRAAVGSLGLTDEVFAVAAGALPRRSASLGWLMVLEAGAYSSWLAGTLVGASGGSAIVESVPSLADALGFALPALFAALIVSLLGSSAGVSRETATAVLLATAIAATFHILGLTNLGILAAGVAAPAGGMIASVARKRSSVSDGRERKP